MTVLRYANIGMTVKTSLENREQIVGKVVAQLQRLGAKIFVDVSHMDGIECVRECSPLRGAAIDLLLVIGGDGTILRAVRELNEYDVPVLGINRGMVGFLAEINIDEVDTVLPALLRGDGELEERSMLHISVRRDGKEIFTANALNDAVLSQGTISRLALLKASVGSELLSNYHADGLIISTPTGSTAYSLSAGGPVVHPRLSAVILTPINPYSLSQRPIVLPGRETIEVRVMEKDHVRQNNEVGLTIDGQVYQELQRDDIVTAKIHDKGIRFLRRKEDTFFHTLRTKLKWGE